MSIFPQSLIFYFNNNNEEIKEKLSVEYNLVDKDNILLYVGAIFEYRIPHLFIFKSKL